MTSLELEAFDTAEASDSRPLCSSIRAGDTVYVSGWVVFQDVVLEPLLAVGRRLAVATAEGLA